MAKIKGFGQYVLLEIKDVNGNEVLFTDSLRVDFDIREMFRFSRCKVTIYNLKATTAKSISSGNNYVTIKVSLHGGELTTLVDSMYVSNSITTNNVPNTLTYLYCFSKVRKTMMEKQISKYVIRPSLEKVINELTVAGGLEGRVEFKFFPDSILKYVPSNPKAKLEGSVIDILDKLSRQYKFKYYTSGSKDITIGYVVDDANYTDTDLSNQDGSIELSSLNMRSNPKLGPSTLEIESNLDTRIKPMGKLDVKKLLTAELTGLSDLALSVSNNLVLSTVAGRSIYQVLFVRHLGSNWTKDWATSVQAATPTKGFEMPTSNTTWFR